MNNSQHLSGVARADAVVTPLKASLPRAGMFPLFVPVPWLFLAESFGFGFSYDVFF